MKRLCKVRRTIASREMLPWVRQGSINQLLTGVPGSNIAERTHDTEGNPTALEYKGRLFHAVDHETEDKKDFGFVYNRILRFTEKVLDKYGIKKGMTIAKMMSKLDLASGYVFLGATLLGGVGLLGISIYLSFRRLSGDYTSILSSTSANETQMPPPPDPIRLNVFLGTYGVVAVFVAGLAILRVAKTILDNSQKVLVNQMLRKVREKMPEKYFGFLEREKRFREYDDAERIVGGTLYSGISRIPVLNVLLAPFLQEYVNIKFEKKQLQALEEMERYLFS